MNVSIINWIYLFPRHVNKYFDNVAVSCNGIFFNLTSSRSCLEKLGRFRVQTTHVFSIAVEKLWVYLEWPESDAFLVVVVPGAPQLSGLVENLLDLRVVLNDDRGLHVAARGVGLTTSLRLQASWKRIVKNSMIVVLKITRSRIQIGITILP